MIRRSIEIRVPVLHHLVGSQLLSALYAMDEIRITVLPPFSRITVAEFAVRSGQNYALIKNAKMDVQTSRY